MQRDLPLVVNKAPPAEADSLWRAFVAAQERSKTTLALDDGIAAGKAYRAFLEAFVAPDLRIRRSVLGRRA
jgi:hypothetical protein